MTKNWILKTVLLCTLFILFSCQKEKAKPEIKTYRAGVILSFDDAYVDEWFDTDQKLKQYSWKATFCVCKINTLRHYEIKKLLEFQKEGHEIAGHGLHHYHAEKFVKKYGIKDYFKQEINPMLRLMSFYGLKITSFVYPYGGRNPKLDAALLNVFKIIRGRAFCEEDASKQGCYFNHSKIVYSFSIDDTHNHFNIPHLMKLLDYAKKNDEILILNSHKTVENVTADYQTKNATLELICKYIRCNNMKFYTLSDLDNIQ
ncbi:polysaccharide deacetylase family protein [Flavobacterium soyangense]|uniref:Polysaccharide deacetylase family protein n=1 Tax=Flavobacterium soyangense TaxID=2023265 RepID=A0A930XVE2_9FLAO|nr:polysaccharide deacetylase family protein [Flavobacterium soyangense]MBF2708017.1 polysaccharide deacetylase family protein [Flavobacterium soyangense]